MFPSTGLPQFHFLLYSCQSMHFMNMLLIRSYIYFYLCFFSPLLSSISWSRVIWMRMRMSVWVWAEVEAHCALSTSFLWSWRGPKVCTWSMAAQAPSWPLTLTACQRTTSGPWHVPWRRWTPMAGFILSATPAQSQPSLPRCTGTRTETTCQRVPWRSQSYD